MAGCYDPSFQSGRKFNIEISIFKTHHAKTADFHHIFSNSVCFISPIQRNGIDVWIKKLGEAWRIDYGILFFNTNPTVGAVTLNLVELGAHEVTMDGYSLIEAFNHQNNLYSLGPYQNHTYTVQSVLLYYVYPS